MSTLVLFQRKDIIISAITIQELRVTQENECNYLIDGYTPHFLSPTYSSKGGLVTFLKNDFKGTPIRSIYNQTEIFEALLLEVSGENFDKLG